VSRQITLPYMSFGSDAGSLAPEGVPFLRSNPHPRAYGNFARCSASTSATRSSSARGGRAPLTSLPADNLGLAARGRLRPAPWPTSWSSIRPRSRPRHVRQAAPVLDGRVARVRQRRAVLRDGEHTGATPGRVVRGPGYVP
jgi:N-acyl-D-amino-acid deacylase